MRQVLGFDDTKLTPQLLISPRTRSHQEASGQPVFLFHVRANQAASALPLILDLAVCCRDEMKIRTYILAVFGG